MEVIIIICVIGILGFLYSNHVNKNATKGKLPITTVIYLNGCLGYQSGVEVKISATSDQITVDEKCHIIIQKISSVKLTETKQLVKQQKSAIGRAVIGTLIAGPIGGIVGGVSGVGETEKTEDIEILYITYKDMSDEEQTISFAWKSIDEKSVVLNSWISGLTNKSLRC